MFRFEKPIEEKYRIHLEQELLAKVKSACQLKGIAESEIPLKVIIDDMNDGGWSLENGILNRSLKVIRHRLQARLECVVTKQSSSTTMSATSSKDYPKTPVELASWLLNKLKPEIDSGDERMLASPLIHLGFDSIEFTRMGAMLPELLDALYHQGCINIKASQNKYFATPILMKHSMLSFAHVLWNENPERSLGREKEEVTTPLLGRLAKIEKNSMDRLLPLKTLADSDSPKTKCSKLQNITPINKRRVFVTGGAGFLGAHVIRDLLSDPEVSEVICLVRGSAQEDAAARARRITLTGHESLNQAYLQKIKIIDGDLNKDKFGLQDSKYETLIHDRHGNPAIDSIIHAAAMIKTWRLEDGLDTLTETNVNGTLRIAQLAFETSQYRADQQLTPVVYVSTNSVHCDEVCRQDNVRKTPAKGCFGMFADESAIKQNLNAYAATKLMGEQILRESGLPLSIVRAPLLTWNTETGYGNEDDWLNRLVDACIRTRMIPQFDSKALVRSMPVNQCSALITQNAKNLMANAGSNPFSIEYPYQGVPGLSLSRMFNKLAEQARENGMNMRPVSVAMWDRELKRIAHTNPTRFHPLLTMLLGINNKRSGSHEVSQMKGIVPWLQGLLSTHMAERPSSAANRLRDTQNNVYVGFFNNPVSESLTRQRDQKNEGYRLETVN
ncbi:SDR family oxidoreductase [Rickettsiella massiliensis]|uniref:SDR family oxidoreductase n=1 Tax=Rickettsiella massiliensis TaxID=676517 RepID=UPI00029AE8A1|nr:SDR family oxidoreductase [Rickettsiella massiliensis]